MCHGVINVETIYPCGNFFVTSDDPVWSFSTEVFSYNDDVFALMRINMKWQTVDEEGWMMISIIEYFWTNDKNKSTSELRTNGIIK